MEVSARIFPNTGSQCDEEQRPLNQLASSLEILKRLDYWHPCEVPTLLNLALSHVIVYLPRQEEKPLETPAEPFQKCFSRVPVIRYLASQQLLIPLLKRVPAALSMSELKLSEFLNPEECLHLLQKFGKDLYRLYFYRPSLGLSMEKLAELAPNLKEIEVNEPLPVDEIRQLMSHYPNIQRIGPNALRAIDSATLRELLQTCTELTDLDYVPPYDMPAAHVSLKDIFSSSLRKLRISNAIEDAFGCATRCPNLTSLEITRLDENDPLRTTLQQCSKLTKLSLPIKIDKMKTDDTNEKPTTPNFTAFDKISKVTGNVALIKEIFYVTFPNAEIRLTLTGLESQSITTFFETKQNIRSFGYAKFYSHDKASFHKCLELSGAYLESITLGEGVANDTDIDKIVMHCKKIEEFGCIRPTFGSAALIRLFEATMLKKVLIMVGENCNDQVVKSLLEKSGKSLVHLSILDCPITITSLHTIAQLGQGLKELSLVECNQIFGADLVQLVYWTPNLKVAHFGPNLSNDDIALMSQRLPNLRSGAFTVNDSFDIEKGWKCFSDDIAIEFCDKNNYLIFQNEKANTERPRNQRLPNGFVSFNNLRNGTFFRGYMKNNMPHHGKGKFIYADGSAYEGDYQDGKKHGKGKFIYASGNTYEGDYQDGKPHGKGKFSYANGTTYEGDHQDGKQHGKGKLIHANGDTYEGDYQDGKPHKGKFIYASGNTYEGDYQDGKPHGKGKFSYANGTTYEGDYQDGKPHGKGKLIHTNGDTYEGDYQDGKPHGKGKLIHASGDTYEGDWQDGKQHGKGKLIQTDGTTYEGDFQDGKEHGKGKLIHASGTTYEAEFVNDKFEKILPCNLGGSDLKKQFIDAEDEGKESEKSEESESKGQKTRRSETREEEEKADGNPLKKRSKAEQETRKGQKMPRAFEAEDEETLLLQKRSRNE